MFDIGWSELLVVAVVTILVVGPKELPGLLRTMGKTFGNLKRMAGDFQSQFNEALKEAELDEVQNTISTMKKLDPHAAVKDAVKKQLSSVDEIKDELSSQLDMSRDEINAAIEQGDTPPDVISEDDLKGLEDAVEEPFTGLSDAPEADLVEEAGDVANDDVSEAETTPSSDSSETKKADT